MVRKRFQSGTVDRALASFRRFGIMAVLIPSILPPPAPFKIFVLLSGVAKIPVTRFIAAIAIGRGTRYFVEGLLAVWYGERAMVFIRENGTPVALGDRGAAGRRSGRLSPVEQSPGGEPPIIRLSCILKLSAVSYQLSAR